MKYEWLKFFPILKGFAVHLNYFTVQQNWMTDSQEELGKTACYSVSTVPADDGYFDIHLMAISQEVIWYINP